MLDDSDVFSIDIDRRNPRRVLASACSGIYRSLSAGAMWGKLRGSADASFRTYVVAHDPHVAGRVWAGTTHGLMRSPDGGTTWRTVSRHSVKSKKKVKTTARKSAASKDGRIIHLEKPSLGRRVAQFFGL